MTFFSWLSMGGYAAYVWPAFGIVFSVLAYNGVNAYRNYRAILKQLRLSYETSHAPHS